MHPTAHPATINVIGHIILDKKRICDWEKYPPACSPEGCLCTAPNTKIIIRHRPIICDSISIIVGKYLLFFCFFKIKNL